MSAIYHYCTKVEVTIDEAIAHFESGEWAEHMAARMFSFMDSNDDRIFILPYKYIIEDPYQSFCEMLNTLEIDYDKNLLFENCEKSSFEQKTGRAIGEEKLGVHTRNGSTNQYINCGLEAVLSKAGLSAIYAEKIRKLDNNQYKN